MTRLLIAMLALLTGLAVQAAPAAARAGGVAVGAEVGSAAAIRAVKTVREARVQPQRKTPEQGILGDPEPGLPFEFGAIAAPTVRFGPDRARE